MYRVTVWVLGNEVFGRDYAPSDVRMAVRELGRDYPRGQIEIRHIPHG